ncbi:uncharacterized protein LOC143831502 [Paroedura picta]|uniref:uncharacterized protein LOC143831502 n=1 Tax=Paroedura picta TaxID=143630 RepID=UPI004055F73F
MQEVVEEQEGIKEPMRRADKKPQVFTWLREEGKKKEENGDAEYEVYSHDQGAKESEEKDPDDETFGVNILERKWDETETEEEEAYGEPQDAEDGEEGENRGLVFGDPAAEEVDEQMDFETWKELMESMTVEETHNQDTPYSLPSPEEDLSQPEDDSEANEEETSLEEDWLYPEEVVTSEPDEAAFDKPSPGSCSDTERVPPSQPSNLRTPNYFPVPIFQQIPLYYSVPRWSPPCRWGPSPRRGWTMMPGRGAPSRPMFWPRQEQVRAFPNMQTPQRIGCSWRPPMLTAREASAAGPGRGWFMKQYPQLSGSNISSQSGRGTTQSRKPRGAHVSQQSRGGLEQGRGSAHPPGPRGSGRGQGGSGRGCGSAHPPGQGGSGRGQRGSGQGRGSAHPPGQGGSGQSRGSGQKRPAHHGGGQASSSKAGSNRQTSHRGGQGSGSVKGSQRK